MRLTSRPSVHLERSSAWTVEDGTRVRGTAFVDGRRYDAPDLVDTFASVDSPSAFEATLSDLQGFFAVVHDDGERVYAAVDQARSTPLYYAADGRVLSDSATWVRQQVGDTEYDPVAEAEFFTTKYAYVTGRHTLSPNVHALQPGEAVIIDPDSDSREPTTRFWFRYWPDGSGTGPSNREPLERFDEAVVNAFERLVAFADGRPIVVALSGGYDSRLVLLALRRLGYDRLQAFTFGKPGNGDVVVAREVAENLDVPWTFVEYSPEKWYERFNAPEREAFYEMAFDLDAVPVIEPWSAMWELEENGSIPEDAVVVQAQSVAHCSTNLPDELLDDPVDRDAVVDAYLHKYYSRGDWTPADLESAFRDRTAGQVRDVEIDDPVTAVAAYEDLHWRNGRKYAGLAGRVYEFWGHDWWYPLYDPEVVRCWSAVPMAERMDRAMYETYVDKLYEDVGGVDLESTMTSPYDADVVSRLASGIANSPVQDVASRLYNAYWRTLVRLYPMAAWHEDALGLYGIMPAEQFKRLYTVDESQHTLRAMEAIDRVSFDPPYERDGLGRGQRSVDGSY